MRLDVQADLDRLKSDDERNRLGQFATPTLLAQAVLRCGVQMLPPNEPVRFLDPAFGTGSFFSALRTVVGSRPISAAQAFEIDPHYGEPAREMWGDSGLDFRLEDFTRAAPSDEGELANLLICNPPYVRHHHLSKEEKQRLQAICVGMGIPVGGLAGLYCYFMAISHRWMAPGAVAGWLIPSEFMDVNYGAALKEYLKTKVTLIRIHRFDPSEVQFDDALVTSAVVWFRNTSPTEDHEAIFSFGGSLDSPRVERRERMSGLDAKAKWSSLPLRAKISKTCHRTLGDLFKVKRGIATGGNEFFIMSPDEAEIREIPDQFLTPILPSSRYISGGEIEADHSGFPKVSKPLVLLDCRMQPDEIREKFSTVWRYLKSGMEGDEPISDRYLCRNRKQWYFQEKRDAPPILSTYMGRGAEGKDKPFRFFLNHSKAIAGNGYLMLYPTPSAVEMSKSDPALMKRIWSYLNEVDADVIMGEGRVYGGGLYKLEPKELSNVPLPEHVLNPHM